MEPLSNPVGAPLKASPPRDLLLLEPADDDVSGEGPSRALPDVTARRQSTAGWEKKDSINNGLFYILTKHGQCKNGQCNFCSVQLTERLFKIY